MEEEEEDEGKKTRNKEWEDHKAQQMQHDQILLDEDSIIIY